MFTSNSLTGKKWKQHDISKNSKKWNNPTLFIVFLIVLSLFLIIQIKTICCYSNLIWYSNSCAVQNCIGLVIYLGINLQFFARIQISGCLRIFDMNSHPVCMSSSKINYYLSMQKNHIHIAVALLKTCLLKMTLITYYD